MWFTTESHTFVFISCDSDCADFFFFCMYPAKSVDSFQNYSMWGDTEFPTMLGTQYALSQHAVGLCAAGWY